MAFEPQPEPDEAGLIIYVGQDRAGHWLVQDSDGTLEGRFVSRGAALHYATGECQIHHAHLRIASVPLVPLIPFAPVGSDERALPRAA
ncbi:hypothetical protein [Sphingomonas sp. Leaf21]|jgi:hypothetical protein|uniref:hypothetical protein n=1 Tax=Sphingomonas sp. Leaf21 TaxID=2876550 RepID=UPI001E632EA5|nr:hypothetical protein [Sphingomonas sp. Leaf21]